MIVVIDTSSLLALVRYYGHFDKEQKIYSFFRQKIIDGDLIIIDEVLSECKGTSKGLVIKKLDFLDDKNFQKENKIPTRTANMIAPAPTKFLNLVDNNFTTPRAKTLTSAQFEVRKAEFLNSADMRMIIYVLNRIHKEKNLDIRIVTEETEFANDNKAFKKIPAICRQLGIQNLTLPELLHEYKGIDLIIE
ncbi:DUF4411 family protein [Roseivirga sp.]|uniref:DUF4411 family protein n=1 Tax=Roseivirga sp. TaxID=1964215 RepID=UPI002B2791C5|nr:DUF4411 family protein [Roseivirga sp.]